MSAGPNGAGPGSAGPSSAGPNSAGPGSSPPSAAVVLASAGRPQLLSEAVAYVSAQTEARFTSVVSVPDAASLPEPERLLGWQLVTGTRGLAAQRNAGLDALPDVEVVFFFDDDAVVRHDYVAHGLEFFAAHPEVVGLTGRVWLDGATSGEVSSEVAADAVQRSLAEPDSGRWRPTRELYGCNFAIRRSADRELRFDERLPLYSWLEDHDVARRLMKVGVLAKVEDCVIVHRAAASGGRQAHRRLGYSQVMNPIHLWRKKSFPTWLAAYELFPRVMKNCVRAIGGAEAGWRRQRVRGNLLAALDIVRGRITPERITQL